jgi:hypothetical protein
MSNYNLILVACSVLSALSAFAAVFLVRKPPLPEEIAKVYATKTDLEKAISAINSRLAEERASRARLYERIEALSREVSSTFQSIERSIGNLEGSVRLLADRGTPGK